MGRLIATAAAAAGIALPVAAAPAQTADPVPFTTIERSDGAASRYSARTTLVVRTRKRWRRVWAGLHAGQFPPPRRPRVDFRRYTAIAVLRGEGTGVGIDVVRVDHGATGLRVHAVETRAGLGCVVAQVIVRPYHVIRVRRTSAPVAVERTQVLRSC